jgi:hypothetical protein
MEAGVAARHSGCGFVVDASLLLARWSNVVSSSQGAVRRNRGTVSGEGECVVFICPPRGRYVLE